MNSVYTKNEIAKALCWTYQRLNYWLDKLPPDTQFKPTRIGNRCVFSAKDVAEILNFLGRTYPVEAARSKLLG